MKQFFNSGYAFFFVAFVFLVASVLGEKPAVFLTLGVVFLIIGLAVRKKNVQRTIEKTPKT